MSQRFSQSLSQGRRSLVRVFSRGNRDCTLAHDTTQVPQPVRIEAGLTGKLGQCQCLSLSNYAPASLLPMPARCLPLPKYFMWSNPWEESHTGCQIPRRHNKKLIDCNSHFPVFSCGFGRSNLSHGDGNPPVWIGPQGSAVQLRGATTEHHLLSPRCQIH